MKKVFQSSSQSVSHCGLVFIKVQQGHLVVMW